MIVRDSGRTLPACLESIRPWVDEIIVVDTGSLDATREIAKSFGALVAEFPWVDSFSAARNESIRLASGEWLFWMDSDDTIDPSNGRRLRELAYCEHPNDVLGYVVQVHCPEGQGETSVTAVDHVKLVRNHPDIRFEGRVHEQLLPAIRRLGGRVEWTNLHVVHSGPDNSPSGKAKKYDRDLKLLQLELNEHPNHSFVLFNLGMTYSDMEEHAIAQRWLERCLSASDSAESHVRKAYSLLVNSLKSQGQLLEAHEECLRALDVFPLDVELLFRRGMLEHDLGNFEAAIFAYRLILDSQEERHFVSMDVGLVDYKTHNNLALVYQDSGQLALAEIQWRSIIAQKPNFEEAWQSLGRNLIDQHKWKAMDLLLTVLHKLPHGEANSSWLKAIVAEKQGETTSMRPLLEAALAVNPSHALARQDYCRWLFHFGSVEEAAMALEELVERDPTDAAALHNLGLIYNRSGLLEQAKNAFNRSLELRPNSEATRRVLEQAQLDLARQVPTQREILPREIEQSQLAFHSSPTTMMKVQSGQPEKPLDIVYLFRHSPNQDKEMLYSLRSVAANLPYINKVWIFGDKPLFLTEDTSIVEHIPHEAIAPAFGFRIPVRNEFLMFFLASLIPDLAFDFVKFSDDYVVLQPVTQQRLCTLRAMEDMNKLPVRGRGVFKDFLWNTYDTLKRLGYFGLSFEGHVPQPYNRKIVFDAFREFRDFVSEDRYFGMASATAVCNFAVQKHSKPFIWLESENSKVGFYKSCPTKDEIDSICSGKTFLNFTDKTFGVSMCNFLNERFSIPSKYESATM